MKIEYVLAAKTDLYNAQMSQLAEIDGCKHCGIDPIGNPMPQKLRPTYLTLKFDQLIYGNTFSLFKIWHRQWIHSPMLFVDRTGSLTGNLLAEELAGGLLRPPVFLKAFLAPERNT